MDRNTVIGFLLIFGLLIVWQQLVGPNQAEVLEQQRVQDSIAAAQPGPDIQGQDTTATLPIYAPDTSVAARSAAAGRYGVFAPRPDLAPSMRVLENELVKLTFSSQGGRLVAAEMKQYEKMSQGATEEDIVRAPVVLMNDERNEWNYRLPATGAAGGFVNTAELPFEVQQSGNTITFSLPASGGGALTQRYTLGEGYTLDYAVAADGLQAAIGATPTLELHWVNYLDKVEKNVAYEQQNSLIYWKEVEEKVDYVAASGEDAETAEAPVAWVSHTQQFFNTSLIAEATPMQDVRMGSLELEEEAEDLKRLTTDAKLAYGSASAPALYKLYIGPNEFDRLRATAVDLGDIVPFGWSLFGTVNRWIIRPLFNFLGTFIGQAGLLILALTFIVKLALYPLMYKMLRSQAKMRALKPRLAKMKNKHKDDQQAQQMEQMKLYREYGVNPAGGCLPMVFQMPILFALYRFFPASIEFRQESFLWANDLSSYDEWINFGTTIPLLGDHLSLFTVLWVVTTVAYTYYNSQAMDMGQMANNPAFKYVQYLMPIMFLFFFNSFASGLTVYLVFANLFNITQTLVTKNLIIDDAKIEAELTAAKAKPKKKGGFASKLEQALKEQQRVAAQQKRN